MKWDGFALEFEVPPIVIAPYYPNSAYVQMNAVHYPDFGINQPHGTPLLNSWAVYVTNFDLNSSGESYYVIFQQPELIIDHDKQVVRIVTEEGLVMLEQEYHSEDENSIEFLNVWLNLETGSGFINEWIVELPETLTDVGELEYVPVTFETQHNL